MVKVDIRQLPHAEGLALPAYQSADAAGLDLLAAVPADTPLILSPGKYAMVPTGLTIALPPGFEAQVRPRSGLAAKHGVTVLNSPGTVVNNWRWRLSGGCRCVFAAGDGKMMANRSARTWKRPSRKMRNGL